ncbi:MAG TPA: hypothetical protein VFM02_01595 [Candidatus Paceibacterota bacterium]|nr:hypothetical protein [Candidatus Paceibacterota bacterium]
MDHVRKKIAVAITFSLFFGLFFLKSAAFAGDHSLMRDQKAAAAMMDHLGTPMTKEVRNLRAGAVFGFLYDPINGFMALRLFKSYPFTAENSIAFGPNRDIISMASKIGSSCVYIYYINGNMDQRC